MIMMMYRILFNFFLFGRTLRKFFLRTQIYFLSDFHTKPNVQFAKIPFFMILTNKQKIQMPMFFNKQKNFNF